MYPNGGDVRQYSGADNRIPLPRCSYLVHGRALVHGGIDSWLAEGRIAPLLACLRETRMPGFRHLVVSSLDDNLRVAECGEIAGVVPIEVCGDQIANVFRTNAKALEPTDHKVVRGHPRPLMIRTPTNLHHLWTKAGVDEDIRAVIGLDKVTWIWAAAHGQIHTE
jgi:hypothetical protein